MSAGAICTRGFDPSNIDAWPAGKLAGFVSKPSKRGGKGSYKLSP